MPGNSDLKRNIRTVVRDMREQQGAAALTAAAVHARLTARFPQHLRQKQKVLESMVAQVRGGQ